MAHVLHLCVVLALLRAEQDTLANKAREDFFFFFFWILVRYGIYIYVSYTYFFGVVFVFGLQPLLHNVQTFSLYIQINK